MLDAATATRITSHNRADHPRCGSHRDSPWLCCQTHPQAERWAAANLTRQGFTAYLPLITVTRRDRVLPTLTHRIEIPLFRGYVFVACPTDHWPPIQHTRGVARLLMSNGRPHRLDAGVLEAVRAAEAQAATRTPGDAQMAPGALVALRWGCFQGHAGVITAVAHGMADVAMIMFGQLRTLSVHVDCLTTREVT